MDGRNHQVVSVDDPIVMKLSIVTVCFNSERTIEGTIKSILSQDYPNVEFIVIDGVSSDRTMEIVNRYAGRINKVVSEPDLGIYDAMNKGIALASGEVIGMLNSDDLYEHDGVLSEVVQAFRRSPDVAMVYGDVVFVRPDDLNAVVRFCSARRFSFWKLRFGWMPPHPATFIRKRAYEEIGKYRIDMKISADYEWFVRAFGQRIGGVYLPRVLVKMRTGGVSTSGLRSIWTLNREIVRACRENGLYTNMVLLMFKMPFKLLELVRRPR